MGIFAPSQGFGHVMSEPKLDRVCRLSVKLCDFVVKTRQSDSPDRLGTSKSG